MSVWLTIPSARPAQEVNALIAKWHERGYKVALVLDPGTDHYDAEHVFRGEYQGYAKSVNFLTGWLIANEPNAEWFIAAGDDTLPDPNKTADEIARECNDHFYQLNSKNREQIAEQWDTFGVMQPTGDRWGDGRGAYIDRVCGSAWIGREFARRMYGGKGPLWPGYQHMFCDEELQYVSIKMGVLWQRPDLTHHHRHWGRANGNDFAVHPTIPKHLQQWNTPKHWHESKAMFEERKAAGFPGHEPI